MKFNNIINYLKDHPLTGLGFELSVDTDNNLSFTKETQNNFLKLSIPYSKQDFSLKTPNTTIAFKELQKLWVELCYETIADQVGFAVSPRWMSDHYPSYTTMMYRQVNSPSGVLRSKFNNLTIEQYFNLEEDHTNKSVSPEQYVNYLVTYYDTCAKPFFEAIPDLASLDKLTDNLDIYHRALYLSANSTLKKILLMHLTNNPNKEAFTEEFRSNLEINKTSPNVAPLAASLQRIKNHFNSF
jgi:hypothetical protein